MRCHTLDLGPIAGGGMEFLHEAKRGIDVLDNVANDYAIDAFGAYGERTRRYVRQHIGVRGRVHVKADGPGLLLSAATDIESSHATSAGTL